VLDALTGCIEIRLVFLPNLQPSPLSVRLLLQNLTMLSLRIPSVSITETSIYSERKPATPIQFSRLSVEDESRIRAEIGLDD
jgi:hypothetical protein